MWLCSMSEVWQDSELNEQKAQCRVALEITGDPDTWRLVIPSIPSRLGSFKTRLQEGLLQTAGHSCSVGGHSGRCKSHEDGRAILL